MGTSLGRPCSHDNLHLFRIVQPLYNKNLQELIENIEQICPQTHMNGASKPLSALESMTRRFL